MMNSIPEFYTFGDQQTLCDELSRCICNALQKGIETKAKASLVVSGGRTPLPLFAVMADVDMSWEKVFITLADERWVELGDNASNEGMVRQHLLRKKAKTARFQGLKNNHETAAAGERQCEQMLSRFPRPFDIVLLGMGSDGHTASLFPGAYRLGAALDMKSERLCIAINSLTTPYERMTLTLPALLHSKQIIIHITGSKKRRVYDRAVHGGSVEEMPIRAILGQEVVPVAVFWAN